MLICVEKLLLLLAKMHLILFVIELITNNILQTYTFTPKKTNISQTKQKKIYIFICLTIEKSIG